MNPAVLVLHHRHSLAASPYDHWLADYDGDVLLLCSRESQELIGEELPVEHGYRHAEEVTGYESAGRVEARVLDLARRFDIEWIVNQQELDLERAAQLREILGLPGQRLASVLPFRDKALMKTTLREAGIPVADHRVVECATDLVSFADAYGFPLVFKPRDRAGSIGVRILRSRSELDAVLARPLPANSMVESFVPGPMFHVDGLIIGGSPVFVWPSQYLFVEAEFADDHSGRLDVTLDPDDPLTPRLLDFTREVLGALPAPRTFAFHAEVFHTPGDELVLCEVACRTGGAQIRGALTALFGVDPNELWARAEVGLPVDVAAVPREPVTMAGQLALSKRPGVVRGLPGAPPFPWVVGSNVAVRQGQVLQRAAYTSDVLASFVVTAPDRAETERRLRQLEAWFRAGLALGELREAG